MFPGWLIALIAVIWVLHTAREHWQSRITTGKGQTEVYLRYVDRDLRTFDGGKEEGDFWRAGVGVDDREALLRKLRETMELLDENEKLDAEAQLCLHVLRWQSESDPGSEDLEIVPNEESVGSRVLGAILTGERAEQEDVELLRDSLAEGSITPWEAIIAEHVVSREEDPEVWQRYDRLAEKQFERARKSWLLDWFVIVAGLICLPLAIRRLRKRTEPAMGRIMSRWHPGAILCCFFVVEVAGHFVWECISTVQSALVSLVPIDWLRQVLWIGKTLAWQVYGPLTLALIFFARPWHVVRAFGLKARVPWVTVPAGITTLVPLFLVLSLLLPKQGPVDPSDFMDSARSSSFVVMYSFLTACVAAPLFEEIVFRGFLFLGLMKRLGTLPAFALSTILFAVLHSQYSLSGMLVVGTLGGLLAYLTWRTGSLLPAIFLHALHNFLIFGRIYFLYQMPLS